MLTERWAFFVLGDCDFGGVYPVERRTQSPVFGSCGYNG